MEGAGIVEAVGEGVDEVAVGDRVAYAGLPPGAFVQARLIPAHRLVRLPADISSRQAAGRMLRGMTARYLLHGCYPVKSGDTILVHAAAGGVGTILSQWARHLGARVIGTVGSARKAEIARANGCNEVILYQEEDFPARVKEITGGLGVAVVYDSVGQATFMKSLDCLRPMGMMVSFGQSSGNSSSFRSRHPGGQGFPVYPAQPHDLHEKREDLLVHARDLFEVVQKGAVRIEIGQSYPLSEVAQAHRDMEARKTTGSTILIP